MELVTMTTMEISKLLEALILNDNTEREREKGEKRKKKIRYYCIETKEISWNNERIIIELGKTGFFSLLNLSEESVSMRRQGIFKQSLVH